MVPFDIHSFQPRAWEILARSFQSNRLAGTYLFSGRDGIGRWPLCISLTALVNCETPVEGSHGLPGPCGECRNCHHIFSLNFEGLLFALPVPPHKKSDDALDLTQEIIQAKREEPFLVVSGAGSRTIPVASARRIKRSLASKASDLIRVVLFFQMENMLEASTDALLKMIEEPPADTIIVMTARRPDALLPTVRSRAREIRLDRIAESVVAKYLMEQYQVPSERADLLARLSEGSIGAALDLVSTMDGDGGSWRQVGFHLFRQLFGESGAEAVAVLNERVNMKDRAEVLQLLAFWQSLIRDCTVVGVSGDASDITNIDLADGIRTLAAHFQGAHPAAEMTDRIKLTLADLQRNVHIPGALAALVLDLRAAATNC